MVKEGIIACEILPLKPYTGYESLFTQPYKNEMKAYQIQTSDGIDGLKQVDLPEPKPSAGQVLIRVRATSLKLLFNFKFYCKLRVASGHVTSPK